MKTVAGQQLLKDKIAVTLPIKMTPDEVKKLSADTSKGEYNDACLLYTSDAADD